jgi:NAD+ synthase
MEELANRITAWIAEKITGAKCKGVVFGLSGGLDSSVVGVLCKRAFPEDTLAVVMPCYSSDTDIAHAQAVARKFQIPAKTIALEGVFDSLLKVLPVAEGDSANRRMAEANLKVRPLSRGRHQQ